MAIYSYNEGNVSRGNGHSNSLKTLAYITGQQVKDEINNKTYQYGRQERVAEYGTELPEGCNPAYSDPVHLFNSIEKYEKARNARTAKKSEPRFARELPPEQQKQCLLDFIHENYTRHGYPAVWAIHYDKENRNPHAHILVANRPIDSKTGEWMKVKNKADYLYRTDKSQGDPAHGYKVPILDESGQQLMKQGKPQWERIPLLDEKTGKQKVDAKGRKQWKRVVQQGILDTLDGLESRRASWAEICNRRLDQEHHIDHRSLKAQHEEALEKEALAIQNGSHAEAEKWHQKVLETDRAPTVHEGWWARKIERMGGHSRNCQRNRIIRKLNEKLRTLNIQLDLKRRELFYQLKEAKHYEQQQLERFRKAAAAARAALSGSSILAGPDNGADAAADRQNQRTASINCTAGGRTHPISELERIMGEAKRSLSPEDERGWSADPATGSRNQKITAGKSISGRPREEAASHPGKVAKHPGQIRFHTKGKRADHSYQDYER